MIETALGLARRGFKVFPIKPGEKKPPLIKAWEQHATSDEAQIRSWWTQWPTANPGVHCEGLLVIDVDPKKGGYESLARLELEIELPGTYEVSTPSGGRHLYYRVPADDLRVRNSVDAALGAGLDVRATCGYVLGSGSQVHQLFYTTFREGVPSAAPRALVARCVAPETPYRPVAPVQTDADAAVARAQDFLRAHPVAVEGQGGDHHTFSTCCRLRDFGVPEERADEAMLDWNSRCIPPWDADALAVKIQNAYTYAQDAAGKLTPEALGFEVVVPESLPSNPQIGGEKPAAVDLLHPADAALSEILGAEYLIKGVLETQSNAVLFGHWNVGKTFVVLDMAASIATGAQWFGKRVKQGRVLYLGYEGIRAMKKRMIALRRKYPALEDRNVPFEWKALRKPLTQGPEELAEVVAAYRAKHGGAPDLVIVDPLANALGGDDADANLMAALNQCVATLIRKQRCTVLRVHHSGHGNQDRARGHSSLPAGLDTEIRVTEQEIALTKQRDDVRGKLFFALKVVTLGKDSDGDDVTTCIVEQIEENAMSPELTGPQRALLDELIKLRGDNGRVLKTDIRDCAPGTTADQRRDLLKVLERKQYLRTDGGGWVIAERGPMGIFD